MEVNTAFVIITDSLYFSRAKRTIIDLRTKGNWNKDIVLITIDFRLNKNFKDFYNIIEVQFNQIDKSELIRKIGPNGFSNSDKRELNKLNQWEKFHIFDEYFMKWDRIVFLDAGLRVLDDVKYLLELDYKGKILAPKDGRYEDYNLFKCQLSYDNMELIEKVKIDFGDECFNQQYFLNCIWIYDTNIIKICNKMWLIDAMNKYPLCKTNEMGIMNLLFTFKYKLWKPFPHKTENGKILFDWCELNNPNTTWKDYCYIKYPVTISFDDC
jgi:Glycosyl transferase family 8